MKISRIMNSRILKVSLAFLLMLGLSPAYAKHGQTEPVELLIDFAITGSSDNGAVFTIGGPGHAPWYIFRSGEIIDIKLPWREVATLSDGQITFSGGPMDPVVNFSCLQGGCTITTGGSTFTSDAGVPLQGRAINMWGPVINSPDFDPMNGVFPIRILGCGGLTETSGQGKYAGMVGSICFNGVLNFDNGNPFALTGSSKCTITLHTPAGGPIPPEGPPMMP